MDKNYLVVKSPKLKRTSSSMRTGVPSTGPAGIEQKNSKRRSSSFASSSSPWFRRNSLLSPAMVQHENFSVYDSPNYYSSCSSYNIISLKECQGFIFNQDLFASPYQQLRSIANERKMRALSYSKSRSNSTSCSGSATHSRSESKSGSQAHTPSNSGIVSPMSKQRRHTSCHEQRPSFLSPWNTNDDNESPKSGHDDDHDNNFVFDDTTMDVDILTDQDDAIVDEYEEYEQMHDYGESTNRSYKIHVTEIKVNENDSSIFPS